MDKLSREYRGIPADATETHVVTEMKTKNAVSYSYDVERDGKMIYIQKSYVGKRAKPTEFYRYPTSERRDEAVSEFIERYQGIADESAKYKKEIAEFVRDVEVGDILCSSWGYGQENIDWYQITELVGKKSIKMREIASNKKYSGSMDGTCMPIKDQFVGVEMKKQYGLHGAKISSFETARKWDGGSRHWSSWN